MKKIGFSLVELLVVIVILGIVLGISAPSFSSFFLRAHLDKDAQTFRSLHEKAFFLARSEGIVSGVRVSAGDNSFVFFTCENSDCSQKQETISPLASGAQHETSAEVVYLPPFGVIRAQNEKTRFSFFRFSSSRSFLLYSFSGLLESQ